MNGVVLMFVTSSGENNSLILANYFLNKNRLTQMIKRGISINKLLEIDGLGDKIQSSSWLLNKK